jgi:hypothetical protein
MSAGWMMKARNFHPGSAAGTIEGVDLVDPVDELGPSTARGTPGYRLVGFPVRLEPGGVVGPIEGPNPVCVAP